MLHDVELVIDDAAPRNPLLHAEPERLPHVDARRLDPFPLPADQLATKEIVQRLLLPLPAKPQWLRRLQIAHYRQKLALLAPVDFVHPHLPQRRLAPLRVPSLQITQIDGSYRARGQTHMPRHLASRRTLASLPHRLLEALAVGRLARQLRHPLGPYPAAWTLHSVGLHHHGRHVLKAGQIAHFPLADFVNPGGRHVLPTSRANQLQSGLLPSHPELQLLALLVNLHPINPVSRPSQNPCPVVFPHPLRLAKGHLSEKAGLSGRLSDSCAEPFLQKRFNELFTRAVSPKGELQRLWLEAGNCEWGAPTFFILKKNRKRNRAI